MSRSRTCNNGLMGMKGCSGHQTDETYCNGQACAYWASWSSWRTCSRTCNGGSRLRIRQCIGGEAGEIGCEGQNIMSTECNLQVEKKRFV